MKDIRGLLASWSEYLSTSTLVFLRASRSHSKLFFSPSSTDARPLLDRLDPRLRTFPFPTKRATLDELVRCVRELLTVKVVRLTDEELAQLDAPPPSLPQPAKKVVEARPVVTVEKVKRSKDEQRTLDRWRKVIDMVQKARLDALDAFLSRRRDESHLEDWVSSRIPDAAGGVPGAEAGWTLLHVASVADHPSIVTKLLIDWRSDPTVLTGGDGAGGKTAYELAPSKGTRNAFRRAMAAEPDWCDWTGQARVPSALTEEMEAGQSGKGKERKARMKEKMRERDREKEEQAKVREVEEREKERKAREEQEARKRSNGPQKLGGPLGGKAAARESAGMSEEQRLRLERERRARAAEARLAR